MPLTPLVLAAATSIAYPAPPFDAQVAASQIFLRATPKRGATVVGLVEAGDPLRVLSCVPACDAPDAWAEVDGGGFLKLAFLAPGTPPHPVADVPMPYFYGKVFSHAITRVFPDSRARAMSSAKAGHVLSFFPEPPAEGWLERAHGGFVQASEVRGYTVTTLVGEHDPSLPLAFVTRATKAVAADTKVATPLAKYERKPLVAFARDSVEVDVGRLPRANVRIAVARPRPPSVPAGAKWVHVDLREQVLVAYEGERPVFATVVATGRDGDETPTGTFESWYHVRHDRMEGHEDADYYIEDVPSTMYFHASYALHGAFWHDGFGTRRTHGCVNLSPADAHWLLGWAPPGLPPGWHAIRADNVDRGRLWIVIENATTRYP